MRWRVSPGVRRAALLWAGCVVVLAAAAQTTGVPLPVNAPLTLSAGAPVGPSPAPAPVPAPPPPAPPSSNGTADPGLALDEELSSAVYGSCIGLGSFVAFAGLRFQRLSAGAVGVALGAVPAYELTVAAGAAASAQGTQLSEWIPVAAAIFMGSLVGALVAAVVTLGELALGAMAGVVLSLLLNTALLHSLLPGHPRLLLYVCMGSLALAFGRLAVWSGRRALVFSTALSGAYGVVAGVGAFAGAFPNPVTIGEAVDDPSCFRDACSAAVPPTWWAYVGAMGALTGIAAFVQLRFTAPNRQHTTFYVRRGPGGGGRRGSFAADAMRRAQGAAAGASPYNLSPAPSLASSLASSPAPAFPVAGTPPQSLVSFPTAAGGGDGLSPLQPPHPPASHHAARALISSSHRGRGPGAASPLNPAYPTFSRGGAAPSERAGISEPLLPASGGTRQ